MEVNPEGFTSFLLLGEKECSLSLEEGDELVVGDLLRCKADGSFRLYK